MATPDEPPLDPHPLSDWVARSGRRNRDALLSALHGRLPRTGRVIEFGSGAGMHINYFAPHFPDLVWQPSDRSDAHFEHIAVATRASATDNVAAPMVLDLLDPVTWAAAAPPYDAAFCINVLHVAPAEVIDGLARCAAALLAPAGVLLIYGAFTVDGQHTTLHSAALDQLFQAHGPGKWQYKDTRDVIERCRHHGLALHELIAMPEGRRMLHFVRGPL